MKLADFKRFTRSPAYRINMPWDYLKEWIETKVTKHELELSPDFQRHYVWTEAQKKSYVEYALRGGISGKELYFNCAGWMGDYRGPFVLVDGKQRISAALEFISNKLKIGPRLLYYDEFEDKLHSGGPEFFVNVNDLGTRAEVLQWYLDLNTGGTVHTNEELRKVERLLKAERKKAIKATEKG
jgi:hypothetical protein